MWAGIKSVNIVRLGIYILIHESKLCRQINTGFILRVGANKMSSDESVATRTCYAGQDPVAAAVSENETTATDGESKNSNAAESNKAATSKNNAPKSNQVFRIYNLAAAEVTRIEWKKTGADAGESDVNGVEENENDESPGTVSISWLVEEIWEFMGGRKGPPRCALKLFNFESDDPLDKSTASASDLLRDGIRVVVKFMPTDRPRTFPNFLNTITCAPLRNREITVTSAQRAAMKTFMNGDVVDDAAVHDWVLDDLEILVYQLEKGQVDFEWIPAGNKEKKVPLIMSLECHYLRSY
jgi:hypothetical protein